MTYPYGAHYNIRGLWPAESETEVRFLVLGVGDLMLGDEGLGIIAARMLMDEFSFPGGVRVVDCSDGMRSLAPLIGSTDRAVIIDAIEAQSKPGSIYMFNSDEIDSLPANNCYLHDIGIQEALKTARSLGGCPPATIIGVQPAKPEGLDDGLSKKVSSCLPRVVNIVVDLMIDAGFAPWPRETQLPAAG